MDEMNELFEGVTEGVIENAAEAALAETVDQISEVADKSLVKIDTVNYIDQTIDGADLIKGCMAATGVIVVGNYVLENAPRWISKGWKKVKGVFSKKDKKSDDAGDDAVEVNATEIKAEPSKEEKSEKTDKTK